MISTKLDPRYTMKRLKTLSIFIITLLVASCAPSNQAVHTSSRAATASQQDELSGIITQMPASGENEQQWLNARLLEMGPSAIHSLTGMLNAPGTGEDTYARYAINGLAKYVSRPGRETERNTYEAVLLEELNSNHPAAVKVFLMEQLELAGSDKAIPVLQLFIGDHQLHESAIHALKAINTPSAQQALLEELPGTQRKQRIALILALGDMQAYEVVQQLQPLASGSDDETKAAAFYALAQSGNPHAAQILSESGSASHYLQLARRLGEEGHPQQSAGICRKILASDQSAHIQSTALTILAAQEEQQALNDLMEAVQSSDPELRSAALKLAREMEGSEVTGALVDQLQQADPAVQADIISTLGGRGDRPVFSAITPYLEDPHTEVRMAAIAASGSLGGTNALSHLIDVLQRTEDAGEIEAVKTALLQLPTDPLLKSAAEALPAAPQHAKTALIDILAKRRDTDHLDLLIAELNRSEGPVRMKIYRSLPNLATPADLSSMLDLLPNVENGEERSALQEAVIAVSKEIPESQNRAQAVVDAFDNAPADIKPKYLEILSGIGGEQALNKAVLAAKSSNTTIRNTAIKMLASWPDPSSVPHLFEIFQNGDYPDEPAILEGYIRLVVHSKYSSQDRVRFLTNIIPAISATEEKTMLIDALSELRSPAALQAVSVYFTNSDATIREEAIYAAANILAPFYDWSADFDGTDKVLSVLESTAGPEIKQQIEQHIQELRSRRQASEGFTSLFNGSDLSGWTGATEDYRVSDGQLISRSGASGNLFTGQQYSDFILRFEFKLTPGANNGLAIRSPLEGHTAYDGIELQILDNTADKYADLKPWQYHGSVYGVVPAERGHLKPAGQWNSQEVIARGSRITVILNGETILDADLEKAADPETVDGRDHPGLLRNRGHIGFLGHGDEVAFRNIRIRDLNVYYPDYSMNAHNGEGMNRPPEGFRTLFNGENLDGWNGLVGNPVTRAEMSAKELATARQKADSVMRRHWSVRDGILYFDGAGKSLTTQRQYKDFEMMVDWKIEPVGDSGVYLRGTPQVQIWDITENPAGSGGLYNNKKHRSKPLVPADNPIGEWNRMRIKMVGERVTVHLNGQLVVPDVVLENYWNRDKPIYPEGQIELQAHNTPLYFKNVFIREIPRTEPLFNGQDLSGWQQVGGKAGGWHAEDGILYTEGGGEQWEKGTGGGWLSTTRMYDNFKLELEYRLSEGGNSGVFLRAPRQGDPAFEGIEIQLLDDDADRYAGLEPWQYTGSIYDVKAPSTRAGKPAGEWQKMMIVADGPNLQVILNGKLIIKTSLINFMDRVNEHPGLKRRNGYIGLQNHNSRVEFRNVKITEIK